MKSLRATGVFGIKQNWSSFPRTKWPRTGFLEFSFSWKFKSWRKIWGFTGFFPPRDLGFRSHYGKGQKNPLYLNILASPSGSQIYYLFGHVSWYKEPFIFGLLMGQFPGGKTNRVDESPCLSSPTLSGVPTTRKTYCFILHSRPAWPCPDLCLFCFLLTLPRPSSIASSSGRPSSLPRLEFVSTHSSYSPSFFLLVPTLWVLSSYRPFPNDLDTYPST